MTGSVFPTDMGYIGASGFASEKYFCRREPAPEHRALFMGVARPCAAERDSPRMALAYYPGKEVGQAFQPDKARSQAGKPDLQCVSFVPG